MLPVLTERGPRFRLNGQGETSGETQRTQDAQEVLGEPRPGGSDRAQDPGGKIVGDWDASAEEGETG